MMAMRVRTGAFSASPWPDSSGLLRGPTRAMGVAMWVVHFLTGGSVATRQAREKAKGRRGSRSPAAEFAGRGRLDRRADLAEDGRDLAAEEDQGDDRDDGDEGEDQRVLRESLAFLFVTSNGDEE